MIVKIVLNLHTKSNAEIIASAGRIIANMTDNPSFTADEIKKQMAIVETQLKKLSTTMSKPVYESKTADTAVIRHFLIRELTILANKVEAIANSSSTPDGERISTVHSAGMEVKSPSIRPKRVFMAVNGPISGSVKLVAEGGAKANEWQYTTDVVNHTNRVAIQSTTRASTEITGLEKGTYAFFHKAIYPGKMMDWEGPFILTVV